MQVKEDRQKIWDEYKGIKNGPMRRMFLDYNRYYEAECIAQGIGAAYNFTNLKVLDFGCGVADYGIYFARRGSQVTLHDIDADAVLFAKHRFDLEKLPVIIRPEAMLEKFDLVIFGEVLDHLIDPLSMVDRFVKEKTKFIWTSSYPFRSNNPNDVHWQHDHHPETARLQQPAVGRLLISNYHQHNFGGQRNLWTFNITV